MGFHCEPESRGLFWLTGARRTPPASRPPDERTLHAPLLRQKLSSPWLFHSFCYSFCLSSFKVLIFLFISCMHFLFPPFFLFLYFFFYLFLRYLIFSHHSFFISLFLSSLFTFNFCHFIVLFLFLFLFFPLYLFPLSLRDDKYSRPMGKMFCICIIMWPLA